MRGAITGQTIDAAEGNGVSQEFLTRKHALNESLGTAPDPSVTLDLSEYPSLNRETVCPSHCHTMVKSRRHSEHVEL
jgi:hypothetical protein